MHVKLWLEVAIDVEILLFTLVLMCFVFVMGRIVEISSSRWVLAPMLVESDVGAALVLHKDEGALSSFIFIEILDSDSETHS